MALERVKKHLNYLFLDTSGTSTPTWKRAKTSTDFTITMNAETETFDYIADENPTDELKNYKPSIGQTQTAYIGDAIYDFIFTLYDTQATGATSIVPAMLIYQQKETSSNKATQFNALITIDAYDLVAGTITYTIAQRGTPVHGTAVVTDGEPVFTAA